MYLNVNTEFTVAHSGSKMSDLGLNQVKSQFTLESSPISQNWQKSLGLHYSSWNHNKLDKFFHKSWQIMKHPKASQLKHMHIAHS